MKFEQLRYFQEACKYGSISVAAEHNYISQPSFSAAITKLEKELGVTLLNRNSRGVTPTTAGKAILEKIQGIFELVNDINGIAYAHSASGVVQLATIPCLCDRILPLAVKAANSQNLPINISIHCAKATKSTIRFSPAPLPWASSLHLTRFKVRKSSLHPFLMMNTCSMSVPILPIGMPNPLPSRKPCSSPISLTVRNFSKTTVALPTFSRVCVQTLHSAPMNSNPSKK